MIAKIATVTVLLTLVGCANVQPPIDVSTIPNDCANQHRIVAYLDSLANQPQQPLEKDDDFRSTRRSYKSRIWHIKYVCNPV